MEAVTVMQIKFWGVRGSLPAPINSDRIKGKIVKALSGASGVDLKSPEAVANYVESLPREIKGTAGGNTSCIEVKSNGHQIILDAGSGIRELGLELMRHEFGRGQGTAHIFMSHTHWDHIHGFPFFIPAFIPGNKIFFYSPKQKLGEKFEIQQSAIDLFPIKLDGMAAEKEFVRLGEEGIDLGGVHVDWILLHHPGGSWAYRVKTKDKTIVYATDGEYKDLSQEALEPYLEFFQNADLLIFDAMYTFSESISKEGWGHSTSLVGVDLAVKTGVKKLVLFHHDPTYTDADLKSIAEKTEQYYLLVREQGSLEIITAWEGDEIEV